MRTFATRLLGPTLLLGSVVAIWVAVGLGPLASPQTAQVAHARDVAAAPAARPSTGTVLAVQRAGDRILLRVRSGSTTVVLEVSPGLRATGTSLVGLADAADGGRPVRVRLEYAADGSVRTLTRT